jgi:hypothetical protein
MSRIGWDAEENAIVPEAVQVLRAGTPRVPLLADDTREWSWHR